MMPNVGRAVVQGSLVLDVQVNVRGARPVLRGEVAIMCVFQFECSARCCGSRGGPITSAPEHIKEPALSFGFCEPSDFITEGK